MARLARKNIKVFAGSATNNGVFGSLQANNPTTTSDVEQLQSLTAWSEGWNAATMTSEELPPLEEIQGVEYVTTYQQAYLMQEGIPEWASTVTYYKGSLVKNVTATGFQIYNSLTDNNTGNLLSDTSNWVKVMDSDDLYAYDSDVVHIAGSETITGTKTFSVSPLVPTATSGDSTTKAASTEFVGGEINSLNNTVVHLTGSETITGAKTFTSNVIIENTSPAVVNKVSNLTKGTIPSETIYPEISFSDKNGSNNVNHFSVFGTIIDNVGDVKAFVRAYKNYVNSTTAEEIAVIYPQSGNPYTYSPASDMTNSIVTTIANWKAETGYFKLGNGLIIQWGKVNVSSYTWAQVTLPTAFTSTNYIVTLSSSEVGWQSGVLFQTRNRTTTSFETMGQGSPLCWIAIGY